MIRQLRSGAAGMQAQAFKVDNIANNIANINSDGFKKREVSFRDLVYQAVSGPGNPVVPGRDHRLQVGTGTRAGSASVFSQGVLRHTGRDLDFAIEGEGFFRVTLPDGSEAYTRAGAFSRDAAGNIVTAEGYRVNFLTGLPSGWESLSADPSGQVRYTLLDQEEGSDPVEGTVVVYRFRNPAGLESLGRNLYAVTANSGEAVAGRPGEDGFGLLKQGALESANVNLVEEMTQLLMAQRAYELSSRTVRTADEMWSMANQIRR